MMLVSSYNIESASSTEDCWQKSGVLGSE